jgi:hypothetical protein
VAGALELFEARGFERTAIEQIAPDHTPRVRDPGQGLPGLVDDSFAVLARLTG